MSKSFNPKMVYGRPNPNYTPPEKASEHDLSQESMNSIREGFTTEDSVNPTYANESGEEFSDRITREYDGVIEEAFEGEDTTVRTRVGEKDYLDMHRDRAIDSLKDKLQDEMKSLKEDFSDDGGDTIDEDEIASMARETINNAVEDYQYDLDYGYSEM